eukprot:3442239-Pyramimonas_sp.AAC.1
MARCHKDLGDPVRPPAPSGGKNIIVETTHCFHDRVLVLAAGGARAQDDGEVVGHRRGPLRRLVGDGAPAGLDPAQAQECPERLVCRIGAGHAKHGLL